jgi:hypothetical protein
MKERFQRHKWWILTMLLTAPVAAFATGVTNIFSPGTVISSAAVNQNFQQVTDRLTALENANAGGVYTAPDGGTTSCGPSDGTWVMVGEYSDDDGDEYGEYGFYEETETGSGVLLDYQGAPPRRVLFQNGAVASLWNRTVSAYVVASVPNLIAPVDGTAPAGSGIVLTSATVVSDSTNRGVGSKPFSCQRTQTIDLVFHSGSTVIRERDTVIMSGDGASSFSVAEYFTNSDGATILTAYRWQQVPSQVTGIGIGP